LGIYSLSGNNCWRISWICRFTNRFHIA